MSDPMPDAEPPSTEAVAAPRPSPGAWLHAGIRSTFLLRPALERLGPPTPALVLGLVAAWLLLVVAVERLAIPGDATFYAGAINSGWLATLVLLGLC